MNKKEKKIFKQLTDLIENEESQLRKIRIFKSISMIAGGVILSASFTFALLEIDVISPFVYTITAAFGGTFIGLAVCWGNSLDTWPILRKFLDLEKIKRQSELLTGDYINHGKED